MPPVLLILLASSSLTSIVFGSILVYDYYFFIPNLKSEINLLKIENLKLIEDYNILLKSLPSPSDNIYHWNVLLGKGIFNLYFNSQYFKSFIDFNKNDFDYNTMNFGKDIDKWEDRTNTFLESLFVEKSEYSNFDIRLWNTVQFQTNYYFSKIRFLYADTVINSMLIERCENHYMTLNKDFNLVRVIKDNNLNVPKSFNDNYKNIFSVNNIYIKPKISEFKI